MQYSFILKKGKYVLEISTTDREFLDEQFSLWISSSNNYVKKQKSIECKAIVENKIAEEAEITRKNIEKHTSTMINCSTEDLFENKKSDIEQEKNDISKELDVFYAPENIVTEKNIKDDIQKPEVLPAFDSILEHSMKTPQDEMNFKVTPTIKKDSAFLNYIASRNIEKKIDYLLNAAYYLSQYEQKPRFTLKQLNSKLMQNLAIIIDHSVLQEAINRNYIECLPDLTGLVGASEYRLTSYGEKVILDE